MARTFHHRSARRNHIGHDLWSKRPKSQYTYCSSNRKLSRQTERRVAKDSLSHVITHPEYLLKENGRTVYAYGF